MHDKRYVSIDLGAGSGRVIVTTINQTVTQDIIHRFTKYTYQTDHQYLDMKQLMTDIKYGLTKAYQAYPDIISIGIDTWGVDYGYIDQNNQLLCDPILYRDHRTADIENFTNRFFTHFDLYQKTGIQFLPFNTIYQIADDIRQQKKQYRQASKLLLLPDLIAYMLTGVQRLELTNLSTTGFYNPSRKTIIEELFMMGFNKYLLPDIIYPGETYGVLSKGIQKELDLPELPVIAVATHDTASAIASLILDEQTMFISSGSWSLIGKLLDEPLINKDAYESNYTNEVGYDHHIRFLKNIPGFLIKNQIIQSYFQTMKVNYDTLDQLILEQDHFDTIIDLNDSTYLESDVLIKIKQYAEKTNQQVPKTIGEYLKTFNNSLACKYRENYLALSKLTNKAINRVVIIGGGSQNKVLNQLVADAVMCDVYVGSAEATALGNALIQHQAYLKNVTLEQIKKDVKIEDFKMFHPNNSIDALYKKYLDLMRGVNHE